jgi:hypothetical protein
VDYFALPLLNYIPTVSEVLHDELGGYDSEGNFTGE